VQDDGTADSEQDDHAQEEGRCRGPGGYPDSTLRLEGQAPGGRHRCHSIAQGEVAQRAGEDARRRRRGLFGHASHDLIGE
jgi:hypothetical protein